MNTILEYAKNLVIGLINDENVSASVYECEDKTTIVEIVVPLSSMKFVIGKSGRNAKAIRTLIETYAYINNLGKVKINFDAI